jgi:hypothetical protein
MPPTTYRARRFQLGAAIGDAGAVASVIDAAKSALLESVLTAILL